MAEIKAGITPGVTHGMVPSVRRLAPQLIVAGVLPVIGYSLLRPHVGSDFVALAAVTVFPVAEISFERVRHGRFEPIGIIALIGIVVGILGAVAFNGNATLLKVRESLLTGIFGLVCLATLGARRPVMFYMARAFSAGGDKDKMAEFDGLLDVPGVSRRFRVVTAVWAAGLLAEAGVRTALAVGVSTQLFLEVSPVINWGVLGGLLWFTTVYSRAGERRILAQLSTTPAAGVAASSVVDP